MYRSRVKFDLQLSCRKPAGPGLTFSAFLQFPRLMQQFLQLTCRTETIAFYWRKSLTVASVPREFRSRDHSSDVT
ncbi:MAG TPA: hypothetical protein VHA14_16075, partial [Bryobacteraceae bacterium]|nr:hypothetical protein [Bryobacteraceae bacterium]